MYNNEFNIKKYLLVYLDCCRDWLELDKPKSAPVIEISWSMLRDLLHCDILLQYRPQEIAISIIYFVCTCYGIKIPCNDVAAKDWWKVTFPV